MKNTYFLDKIHNVNFLEFEKLIKAIVKDLGQENFPYTFFKKNDKWIIDIERENDLINIVFDDYSMYVYNSQKKESARYSSYWQTIFKNFLTKKQQMIYNNNLIKEEDEKGYTNAFTMEDSEISNYVDL